MPQRTAKSPPGSAAEPSPPKAERDSSVLAAFSPA